MMSFENRNQFPPKLSPVSLGSFFKKFQVFFKRKEGSLELRFSQIAFSLKTVGEGNDGVRGHAMRGFPATSNLNSQKHEASEE